MTSLRRVKAGVHFTLRMQSIGVAGRLHKSRGGANGSDGPVLYDRNGAGGVRGRGADEGVSGVRDGPFAGRWVTVDGLDQIVGVAMQGSRWPLTPEGGRPSRS